MHIPVSGGPSLWIIKDLSFHSWRLQGYLNSCDAPQLIRAQAQELREGSARRRHGHQRQPAAEVARPDSLQGAHAPAIPEAA